MASVTVIIVNYNAGTLLARVLTALAAQTHGDFAAVIIDNASTDGSLEVLPNDPRFTIVHNELNAGFAVANNQAGLVATTDYIVCLNPDAVPEPDWLAQLMGEAEAHPGCDFFGSTQLRLDAPEIADGLGDNVSAYGLAWRGFYNKPVTAPYPSGYVFAPCAAASMYRTSRFKELGGFAENYFCYFEDVDLAFRHRLQGGRVWQSGKAVVGHYGSATSAGSTFALYHGVRNLIWTYWRCMPLALLFLLVVPHWLACLGLWKRAVSRHGKDGHKAFWRAVRDAYDGLPRILAERRHIQGSRRISTLKTARMLVWSPLTIACRRVKWLKF